MAPLEDGAGGPGPVVEEGPQSFGDGEDELAHRDVGEDVVHQVGRGVGHALGVARGAGAPALAGKRDEEVVPTGGAASTRLELQVHATGHGLEAGFIPEGKVSPSGRRGTRGATSRSFSLAEMASSCNPRKAAVLPRTRFATGSSA